MVIKRLRVRVLDGFLFGGNNKVHGCLWLVASWCTLSIGVLVSSVPQRGIPKSSPGCSGKNQWFQWKKRYSKVDLSFWLGHCQGKAAG